MWWWQSQELAGAFTFGASVPSDHFTGCAAAPDPPAATAAAAAPPISTSRRLHVNAAIARPLGAVVLLREDRTRMTRGAIAHSAGPLLSPPVPTEEGKMASVPGVVTDTSRIKGGVISLASGGGQIAAYVAQPNEPGNYPGIVVIQEAFGLVDHICDLARRFANIGYSACAPALYWRRGAPK